METIEASIVLKGMEIRVMEALNDRILSIQKDAEIAVKKAVDGYDFDAKIGEIVTGWLDDQIRDMAITISDSAMFDIESELSRLVRTAMRKALDDRGTIEMMLETLVITLFLFGACLVIAWIPTTFAPAPSEYGGRPPPYFITNSGTEFDVATHRLAPPLTKNRIRYLNRSQNGVKEYACDHEFLRRYNRASHDAR